MDGSKYKEYITEVPNFPIKDVSFKDVSPLLANHEIFKEVIGDMGRLVKNPDYWIGVDARGFIFASALSMYYGGGVVLCRKKHKLPPPKNWQSFNIEYGTRTLEMKDGEGEVVIVDDVLATGGTLQATNWLAEKSGYKVVDNIVLIDLKYVPRDKIFDLDVKSLVEYE